MMGPSGVSQVHGFAYRLPSHEELLNLRNDIEAKASQYGRYGRLDIAAELYGAVARVDEALDLHERAVGRR